METIKPPSWFGSIRSLITLLISGTFCYMAVVGKIEAKDFMLITSLVMNFYFLAKKRENGENNGGEVK